MIVFLHFWKNNYHHWEEHFSHFMKGGKEGFFDKSVKQ